MISKIAYKDPSKDVTYDFERKIWTNLVSNSSVPTTEWFYNRNGFDGPPYPILNDILTITLQENFNGLITSYTIRSSNFCAVHEKNGFSCFVDHGPRQGLGKADF